MSDTRFVDQRALQLRNPGPSKESDQHDGIQQHRLTSCGRSSPGIKLPPGRGVSAKLTECPVLKSRALLYHNTLPVIESKILSRPYRERRDRSGVTF